MGASVSSAWSNFWTGVKDKAQEIWSGLNDGWRNFWNDVSNKFSQMGASVSSAWSNFWTGLATNVQNIWSNITSTIRGAVNGIIGFINRMISAVVGGLNGVVDLLNGLSFDVPEFAQGVLGERFGFNIGHVTAPQIPYLAQGAVIPPNREFMAVLGDQSHGTNVEAPLATIQQAVAAVMQDNLDGELAALEGIRGTLLDILQAVYGIDLSSNAVGRAVDRYQVRQAIITGRG